MATTATTTTTAIPDSAPRISRPIVLHPDEKIVSVNGVIGPTVSEVSIRAAKRYAARSGGLFAAMAAASNREAQ